jgi:hypothetical protein
VAVFVFKEVMAGPDDIPIVIGVTTGDSTEVVGALDDAVIGLEDNLGKLDATAQAAAGSIDEVGASAGVSAANVDKLTAAAGKQSGEAKAAADSNKALSDSNLTLGDTAKGAADSILSEADAAKLATANLRAQMIVQEELAANMAAANSALGSAYVGMSKLEALGTPAIMKAATWTVLGAGGLAYEGIKQYMNFNKLITQTVTQAGVAPSNMGFLSQTAENISKLTGVKLDDVANSLYRVASGTASWNDGLGATKKQLADITTSVTKLQVLGNVPAGAASEQAARVIVALVNSNLKGVGTNPAAAAALINAAVGSGDMRLNDLVPGIGRGVLQSAKANGMSAKDMLSWIALQTSMGTTANVAGNYVKTGINLLANPSAQGVLAEAMIGIKPGEMQGLISSKGGLQAAVAAFNAAVQHFNPSTSFVGYRTNIGNPRPGGTGEQAAINKLETWAVGEMPAAVLKQWQHGGSAASGGLTAANQQWITDLILTKAFGGSKQFATIAAITKNPQLLAGIETSIGNKSSQAYYNSSYAIAENTPSQRFDKAMAALTVDLVKAGKVMYPAVIKVVDGLVWFVGKILSWKPALYEIGVALTAIVGFAALVKAAELGKGAMSIYGGLLTRLNPNGTSGSYFRNAYNVSSGKSTQVELGAAVRDLQLAEGKVATATVEGATKTTAAIGELMTSAEADTARLQTTIIETSGGKLGGLGRGLGATGAGGVAGEEAGVLAFRSDMSSLYKNGPQLGPVFPTRMGPTSPMEELVGQGNSYGAASSILFQRDQAAMLYRQKGMTAASEFSGVGNGPSGYPEPYVLNTPEDKFPGLGLLSTGAKDASSAAPSILSELRGLGGGALGLVGGPVGVAMIAATVLPMAMPYMIKGLSPVMGFLGHLFSGGRAAAALPVPSVVSYNTIQDATQKVNSIKKSIAAMLSGGFDPSTASMAEKLQWWNLHQDLSSALGTKAVVAKQNPYAVYKQAYALTNNANLNSLISKTGASSFLNNTTLVGGVMANFSGAALTASQQAYKDQVLLGKSIQGNTPWAKAIREMLQGAQGKGKNYLGLYGDSASQIQRLIYGTVVGAHNTAQNLLNSVNGVKYLGAGLVDKHYNDTMAAQGAISRQVNWGAENQFLSTTSPTKKYSASFLENNATNTIATAIKLAKEDFTKSQQTSLGPVADKMYLAASKTAATEASKFEALRSEIIANGKKTELGSKTIKDMTDQINKNMTQLFDQKNLSAAAFGNAFASALAGQSRSLAAMINKVSHPTQTGK